VRSVELVSVAPTHGFQYGEAVTRSERDRAREEAVYRAQDWTPVLRAVEAMPDGQAEIFELAHAMYPPPLGAGGRVDFRTRAAHEWYRNQLAVMRVWADLVEAGLVEIIIPADGVHGDLFIVSEAGHRWLVEHDTLTGGEGLP
jgi:hypothetical protein